MSLELLRLVGELDEGQGVALARLAKRRDTRVSVLLRELTALGDARLGAQPGCGWVQLACDDTTGRWTVALTPAGRAVIDGDA
jgi:hypothetical protein